MNDDHFKCICKQTWSDSVKINFIQGKIYICHIHSNKATTAYDEDNSPYTFVNNTFYNIFYTEQEIRLKKLKKLNGGNL